MKKSSKSTIVPLALLAYLGVIAYMGREHFLNGDYLFYFGVIGVSLGIILLVYIILRKRDKVKREHDQQLSRTYSDKYRKHDVEELSESKTEEAKNEAED